MDECVSNACPPLAQPDPGARTVGCGSVSALTLGDLDPVPVPLRAHFSVKQKQSRSPSCQQVSIRWGFGQSVSGQVHGRPLSVPRSLLRALGPWVLLGSTSADWHLAAGPRGGPGRMLAEALPRAGVEWTPSPVQLSRLCSPRSPTPGRHKGPLSSLLLLLSKLIHAAFREPGIPVAPIYGAWALGSRCGDVSLGAGGLINPPLFSPFRFLL